jgi:hypothetical protein
LSGAMRYAAERSGQDSKYTKLAATWLRKGSWANEPAKPAGTTIDDEGNPVRLPDRQQTSPYGEQFQDALATARRLAAKQGVTI